MLNRTRKLARRVLARTFSPEFYTVSPSGHLVFYWPSKASNHQPVSWAVEDAERAEKMLDGLSRTLRREHDIRLTSRDEPRLHFKNGRTFVKIAAHSSVPDSVIVPALEDLLGFGPV